MGPRPKPSDHLAIGPAIRVPLQEDGVLAQREALEELDDVIVRGLPRQGCNMQTCWTRGSGQCKDCQPKHPLPGTVTLRTLNGKPFTLQ